MTFEEWFEKQNALIKARPIGREDLQAAWRAGREDLYADLLKLLQQNKVVEVAKKIANGERK